MYANPYKQYKQTAVETASPERLVIMLYDGAIRFLRQAKDAVEGNRIEEANSFIGRTQDIINEFIVTLDLSVGGIARNLFSLYDYWNRRLIEANLKKDPQILLEVLGQVEEMRETWAQAAIKYKEEQPKAVGGVNIEG